MGERVTLALLDVGVNDPRWADAQRFVYDEYLAYGWCDPAPDFRVDTFRRHNGGARMYLAVDPGGRLVATARVVDGAFSPESNPTVAAVTEAGVRVEPHDGLWRDIGGWVVAPEFRGGPLGTEMWRIGVADAVRDGFTGITCATHVSIADALDSVLGLPIVRLGGPVEHLGSEVQAASLLVEDLLSAPADVVEYFCECVKRSVTVPRTG